MWCAAVGRLVRCSLISLGGTPPVEQVKLAGSEAAGPMGEDGDEKTRIGEKSPQERGTWEEFAHIADFASPPSPAKLIDNQSPTGQSAVACLSVQRLVWRKRPNRPVHTATSALTTRLLAAAELF